MVTITIAWKKEKIKKLGGLSRNPITFCDCAKNPCRGKISFAQNCEKEADSPE